MNIQSQLQSPYSRETWLNLLRTLFSSSAELFAKPVLIADPGFHGVFTRVWHLGDLKTSDNKTAALLDIEVAPDVLLPRNRAGIRHLAARLIDGTQRQGILSAFHSAAAPDWRFSFIAREKSFDLSTGATACRETPARRFTYLLGPAETCRTAAERFSTLQDQVAGSLATFANLETAFSVEKLSDAFFTEYIGHYETFAKHAARFAGAREWQADTESARNARHFAKRLLARLVFLNFLQKKHWIGCSPASAPAWADGDTDFLHHRFQSCPEPERYHTTCLIPLFYETLNSRRPKDLFKAAGSQAVRIPYLNGGLFEENPAEKPFRSFDFPAKLFQDLFAFFARFNFTIDESDPIDIEIGVDPEMLGRIFEALLEDNKEKGAYYTPKAIVAYMCQEALIRHLHTNITPDATAADLETVAAWIRSPDKSLAPGSFVKTHGSRVDHLLRDIKICDPAIGSGAFPMGMLQEIVRARLALNPKFDPAALKAHTIQNSIYGVDLDSGAVDIARLRFWLSLVVDEHEPRPLPNLDYKIMQGNSLLESFEGVDLSRIHTPETVSVKLISETQVKPTEFGFITEVDRTIRFEEQILTLNKSTVETLDALLKAYFSESDPDRKHTQRQEIDNKVRAHIADNFRIDQENVRASIDFTKDKIAEKKRLHHPLKSEERTLETLKTRLAELERAHKQLNRLDEFSDRPYFLWHLFFHDVFAAGGFDVVIGNPPYVRQETIKDAKPALKAEGYKCFDGVADLLVYFYERGVTLLRDGGVIALITSNKFYRAGYGEKLREFLARELTLHNLIDFGDAPVFEAIAYASILTGTHATPEHETSAIAYTWEKGVPVENIASIVTTRGQAIRQVELKPDGWRLEKPAILRLLEKLRKTGKPLGEYVDGHWYWGIKTGLNEAFVIDRATRDQLVFEHTSSCELIKPFLRGRDAKRWRTDFSERYLIKIESSENKHHPWSGKSEKEAENIFAAKYPAIHRRFELFRSALKAREDQGKYFWELRSCTYWTEFERMKLVVPAISGTVNVSLDLDGFISNNKTSVFVCDDATYVAAVVNSKVAMWFTRQVFATKQGGFYDFEPRYSSQWPIPAATPQQKAIFKTLVDGILAVKTADHAADVSEIESQIDHLVYALYDLTPEDIALVEGTPKTASTATLEVFPVGQERFVAELTIRVAMRYPGLQVNDYASAVGLLFSAGDGLATYIMGDPQKTAWLTVWKKVAKGRSFLKGAGVPNLAQLTADLRKSGFFTESADTAECQLTTPLEPDATLDAIVPFIHVAWLNHRKLVAPLKTGAKDAVQAMEGELMLRGGGNANV